MTDRKNFIFKPGLKDDGIPLVDIRTIPFRAVLRLKELPLLPERHDAHVAVGGVVDNRMFGNNKHGNCVIASQAHQTLTFEKFEQGIILPITDQEVIDEYYRQSGGLDTGLYLTLAMREWRNTGWVAAGKYYDIYAFAGVDLRDISQVKYSIYLLNGVTFGMQVWDTDIEQFQRGEPWHLTGNDGSFRGGHGVDGFKYDEGLTCMTWGEEQSMTWEFWLARVNQAFAVVDNRNKWQGEDSPVDVVRLDGYLKEITGSSGGDSTCPVGNGIAKVGNILPWMLGNRGRFYYMNP